MASSTTLIIVELRLSEMDVDCSAAFADFFTVVEEDGDITAASVLILLEQITNSQLLLSLPCFESDFIETLSVPPTSLVLSSSSPWILPIVKVKE